MADLGDLFSLEGRVAIVTGAAGLYGRPISEALAAAGATVVLAARGVGAIEDFAAELGSKGYSATGHHLDQADADSVDLLCDDVLARFGRIDVLVNNAVHRSGSDFLGTRGEDFEATHRVNGTGLFRITQRCASAMAEAGSGSIINVSSIYGAVGPDFTIYAETGMTNAPSYAYDKGGMIAFSRYLATCLGPQGIRSNCLVPGGLETEQDERFIAAYCRRTPLRRMAEVDDVKGPVLFLASDASRYVTGVTLPVDGGWTAQ
jgi:NAD(P)-dependent dehydrogenase (short-subunit alcohol dehydrogenase family)